MHLGPLDAEDWARRQEMAGRLERFVTLPPRWRQALLLFVAGKSWDEIAHEMAIKTGTVNQYLTRSYRHLQLPRGRGHGQQRIVSYLIGFVDGLAEGDHGPRHHDRKTQEGDQHAESTDVEPDRLCDCRHHRCGGDLDSE